MANRPNIFQMLLVNLLWFRPVPTSVPNFLDDRNGIMPVKHCAAAIDAVHVFVTDPL